MNKFFILISFILFSKLIFSQGIQKNYAFEENTTRLTQVLLHDNTLITAGIGFSSENNLQGVLISKFDTLGNLLQERIIVDTNKTSALFPMELRPIMINDSNNIILISKELPNDKLVFIELDLEFNILQYSQYPEKHLDYRIREFFEFSHGYLLLGRVVKENFDDQVLIIKLDKKGNYIWDKELGTLNRREAPRSGIYMNSDSTIVVGAGWSGTGSDFNKQWIFEMDTLGNINWEWISEDIEVGGGIRDMVPMPNGGYAFAYWPGYKGPEPDTYYHFLGLKRLDQNFEELWNWEWGEPITDLFSPNTILNDMLISQDNHIVAAGQSVETFGPGPVTSNAAFSRIVKFDFDGNMQWMLGDTAYWDYSPDSSFRVTANNITSMVELPSGNIIAVGYSERRVFNPFRFEGRMIKITPDGCIETLCTTTSIKKDKKLSAKGFIVYPNPASDVINVELKENNFGKLNVQLFDMRGALVFRTAETNSKLQIPVLDLISGMYVIQIIKENGEVYSEKVVVE